MNKTLARPVAWLKTRNGQNILLAGLLGALAAGVLLAGLRVWPFGDSSLFTGDLNGLYVNYFADLKNRFWSGGWFYSFGKLAGGSTLGLFAYYMASPFTLVYLLLPKTLYTEAASLCFMLRAALAAGCFCFYIQRHTGKTPRVFIAASLCYALCAFFIVYNQNVIWMDVVALLPLLMWGLDQLALRGRRLPFTLLLAAAIVLNFYTAFSVCLFSVLYFIWLWFAAPARLPAGPGAAPQVGGAGGIGGPGRGLAAFARAAGRLAVSGLLAAGLAMVVLLPALAEVLAGGDMGSFTFSLQANFPLYRLPERLFPGTFFWGDVIAGMPNLYVGLFGVLLAGAYFAAKRIPLAEKLAAGGLLAVLVLSMWLYGPDIIWQGLKPPTWFPHRYSFVFSFFLLVLACRGLLAVTPGLRTALVMAGGGLAFTAYCAFTAEGEIISLPKVALAAAAVLGVAAGVWLWGSGRAGVRKAATGLLCLVLAGDITANAMLSIRKFDYYPRSGYVEYTAGASEVVDALAAHDDGLYRVETVYNRTLNDPMLAGYMGISHYSSLVPGGVPLLRERLGYVNYSVYGWGSTPVADSLFGIKYLYAGGGPRAVPAHYEPLQLGTALPVYQNPYAFPLAYTAAAQVLELDAAGGQDSFVLQNAIAAALAPQASQPLVPLIVSAAPGEMVSFTVTPQRGGPLYFSAAYTGQPPAQLRVNGQPVASYFDSDTLGGVVCLGRFPAGQAVTVELDTPATAETLAGVNVVELDQAAMRQVAAAVGQNAAEGLVVENGGRIACTATAGEDGGVLVLPFSYEENWHATVNGHPARVRPLLGGLMAVTLPAGECQVELSYTHPGVLEGLVVTVMSLILLALWGILGRRRPAPGDAAV